MSINYTFKTEEDLGFYILNAVCHDWIHDFNNYERMGKIVNYIMALIPSREQRVEIAKIEGNVIEAQSSESDVPGATVESAISPDPLKLDIITPQLEEENTNLDDISEIPIDTSKIDTVDTKIDTVDTKIDTKIDTVDTIEVISTLDLYQSQAGQFLEEESIKKSTIEPITYDIPVDITETPAPATATLIALRNIVNRSRLIFNNIKSSTNSSIMTRGNIRKINILQKLDNFIGETQLLVISKLQNIRTRTGGGKQNGGANAIDIITSDDISYAIYTIIEEINETINLSENDKKNLKNIFELMNQVFINFTIPHISQLEKFNNSLITDIISMFIVNKCETMDIKQEAIIYLNNVIEVPKSKQVITPVARGINPQVVTPIARGSQRSFTPIPNSVKENDFKRSFTPIPNSVKKNDLDIIQERPPSPISITEMFGGGPFSQKIYKENSDKWTQLDNKINEIKQTQLYSIYKGEQSIGADINFTQLYNDYQTFIRGINDTIKLVIPPKLFEVTNKEITILYRPFTSRRGASMSDKQKLVDTINMIIFEKIIYIYDDIKNKVNATLNVTTGESSSEGRLSGEAQLSVQKISQLVAKKTLELTGYLVDGRTLNTSSFGDNADLKAQSQIIMTTVNPGKGYTSVDNNLINYFNYTYGRDGNFKSGSDANQFLIAKFRSCNKNCRIINNAIPNGDVKETILNDVICPTSSVCDGMGSFGSCINPKPGRQEYYNMNFNISCPDTSKFYQGSTNLKKNNVAVNINYGFKFNDLELYNFLDINIDTQPIILQANYTFKGVINRIIEIWKSETSVSGIDNLWEMLENTEYFLSILKLGSQKAIGDIFQEINSTLENGGYSSEAAALAVMGRDGKKITFGLMGDRPSGVRVLKLLKDKASGSNTNACGGYIGGETSLIYIPNVLLTTVKKTGKGGTYKRAKRIIKTRRDKKYNNKTTKTRRRVNKKRKTKKM